MNYRIVFENGTRFEQPVQATAPVSPLHSGRSWRRISVVGDIDSVKEAFVDGAIYRQEWDSTRQEYIVDEDGNGTFNDIIETYSFDLSEFCIAGEVVDHRDGTCTVLMGKMTEVEKMQAQIAALMAERE